MLVICVESENDSMVIFQKSLENLVRDRSCFCPLSVMTLESKQKSIKAGYYDGTFNLKVQNSRFLKKFARLKNRFNPTLLGLQRIFFYAIPYVN
jgi:hypothetical protein